MANVVHIARLFAQTVFILCASWFRRRRPAGLPISHEGLKKLSFKPNNICKSRNQNLFSMGVLVLVLVVTLSMHYLFVLICVYIGVDPAFCNIYLLSLLNVLSTFCDVIYPLLAAYGYLRWSFQVIKNFEIILVLFSGC